MKKKLLELLNKKQSIVNRMKSTNEAGDTAGFAAAQNELADVDEEIARVQAIMDAEASVPAPEDGMQQEPGAQSGEGEAVNSAECMHAFAECIRAQARGNRRAFDENADIVRRAAAVENTNQMTEGTPADGGLIVPGGRADHHQRAAPQPRAAGGPVCRRERVLPVRHPCR